MDTNGSFGDEWKDKSPLGAAAEDDGGEEGRILLDLPFNLPLVNIPAGITFSRAGEISVVTRLVS